MFRNLLQMAGLETSSCTKDCSGRGECWNGTCMCDIRFTGEQCDNPNVQYHACIGGIFFLVGFVCAVQLIICIVSEYQRMKAPTFLRACRVTTQKLIYFVTMIASLIRGAYFIYPESFELEWSSSLLSSYYPLLMSSASLIVCFWAEIFHLQGIRWEKPQFLSKSFMGFVTFNILSYGLLLAEVITTQLAKPPAHDPSFYAHLFNGCYAVLLFIVVVFFLIYGVEVFVKVRGGFVEKPLDLLHDNPSTSAAEKEPLKGGAQGSCLCSGSSPRTKINVSQLHQSRIGFVSQALMLITIVGFLFSETLSEFWKRKVPVVSRNWHDIVFRVVEIGVAVWFPAVLWNCMHPAELWILNPRNLLSKFEKSNQQEANVEISDSPSNGDNATTGVRALCDDDDSDLEQNSFLNGFRRECWICYDNEKKEPLIQPCHCTGDVSSVHHECLKRWLIESSTSSSNTSNPTSVNGLGAVLKCKVCNYVYDVKSTSRLDWERGFTAHHWGRTALIITSMCVVVAVAWIIIQLYDNNYIRMMSLSTALMVVYICIKFLGQNTVHAYQRAKIAALDISNHVATISESVHVDHGDSQSVL